MRLQNNYDVGIYCRLSRDDNNGNLESMSIGNQKQMLIDYVKEKGWNLREVYIDDGFTGTHFERPDFQRMIRDIEARRIDCVVTKDLSRLGRNYSRVGYYTDEYFVEKDIRFIAINDSYDSLKEEENEIAPFKNVLNEWYPRDISKKIRQMRSAACRQGKFMGSHAPYGYKKSPENKHLLIIDECSAKIVHRIFSEFVSGSNARMIAEKLSSEKTDCPRYYNAKHNNGLAPSKREHNHWGAGTIYQMLQNQVYIGNMVQGKRKVVSYKTKKRRLTKTDEWIAVEGTHLPIVEQELWERAQKKLLNKGHRVIKKGEKREVSLFAGIIRCADCGSAHAYSLKELKRSSVGIYRCTRYCGYGRAACTPHRIQEENLVAFILNDIRMHAKLALHEKKHLKEKLISSMSCAGNNDMKLLDKQLNETEGRLSTIEKNIKNLYEDKCSGKLPDSVFQSLLSNFIKEQSVLDEALLVIRPQREQLTKDTTDVDRWLQLIEKHMNITSLDRPTVMDLLESITIGEGVKIAGKRTQEITIRYRFMGDMTSSFSRKAKEDIA